MVMMKKKKKKSVICMLLVLLLAVNYATEAESACTRRCGDVDIPFPFGVEAGCFVTGFNVVCNDSKLYYPNSDIQLVGIDLDNSQATVLQPIAGRSNDSSGMNLADSPFFFSNARNIFAAIGCDAAACFSTSTSDIGNFSDFNTGGCVSLCNNNSALVKGTCSSNDGCCQTAIPPRAQEFTFYLSKFNYSGNSASNSRRYSFLVDRSWFYLNSSWSLPGRDFYEWHQGHVPVVVDWWCSDLACPHPPRRSLKYIFIFISAAAGGSFLIFMAMNTLRRRLKKRNLVKKRKENYRRNLQLLKNAQSSSDDIVI